jgi:Ca2+-binding RTX toxin-like protein
LAATIAVDGTTCSLTDAITAANTDTATGGCTAGSGADTLVLVNSSIHTLTSVHGTGLTGLPMVSSTITISGNGSTVQRDGAAPFFGLLEVGLEGDLTVRDLTLRGGVAAASAPLNRGGGVFNFLGTLTLINSTLSDNAAFDSGGGVFNSPNASLTLINSTISGNSAPEGGGVANYGTATVTNSTVSGNTVGGSGGGIQNGGTLTVTSSTLSGNSAAAGGGVANIDTVTLNRTLVSGNVAPTGPEIANFATITANNFNLFGYSGIAGISGFAPGVTDVVPGAGVMLGNILSPVANNGGPTLTHALVTGSPAIDASPVNSECQATDQRGITRPQGAACDIGAFEFTSVTPVLPIEPPSSSVCGGVAATLVGTAGNDVLVGTAARDIIVGLEGDDVLQGLGGNDLICGGPGNDLIQGGAGRDRLLGEGGRDNLRGEAGRDVIEGGSGNDKLNGGGGADTCKGGVGRDGARGCERVSGVP